MNVQMMKRTPSSRATFERALHVLAEVINGDRLRFRMGISTDGIRRVRLLPNRRIDLLTVDESTRLVANMMVQFADASPPAGAERSGGDNDARESAGQQSKPTARNARKKKNGRKKKKKKKKRGR